MTWIYDDKTVVNLSKMSGAFVDRENKRVVFYEAGTDNDIVMEFETVSVDELMEKYGDVIEFIDDKSAVENTKQAVKVMEASDFLSTHLIEGAEKLLVECIAEVWRSEKIKCSLWEIIFDANVKYIVVNRAEWEVR